MVKLATTEPAIQRAPASIAPGRVEGFDLLRGLCAIGVACYHIFSWRDDVKMYNLGSYGVYIFFVLSGASMYVAYSHKFAQGYDTGRFILLRFARLAPLFALVLALTMANALAKGKGIADVAATALLNLSFTFGLGTPATTSAVTGGWSLGIEFVFYFVFPLMLVAAKSRAWLVLLAASFALQHAYIAQTLGGAWLSAAWEQYCHPLSFVFYFMAGCCIGRLIEAGAIRPARGWIALFAVAALPLLAIQDAGNLAGLAGLALSVCAAALALSAAGLPLSRLGSAASRALGRMSYGVYLIHSLVYGAVSALLASQPTLVIAAVTITASAVAALLLERFYEEPVQNRIRSMLRI